VDQADVSKSIRGAISWAGRIDRAPAIFLPQAQASENAYVAQSSESAALPPVLAAADGGANSARITATMLVSRTRIERDRAQRKAFSSASTIFY